MIATIIGLITIALFIGAVYGVKGLANKRGVNFTTVDSLMFIVIACLALALVLEVARGVGESVLALF